jgi:predicted unusual protein kinase regulating ubiquinone biosynthesis (AarF/ABC1/UbiB family)
MVLLTWAAQAAELLRPELQWLALRSTVDNFGWYLHQQTNLTVEASHLRRLSDDFRGGRVRDGRLLVPRVVRESDNVLVTTVARGKSLTRFIQDTSQDESAKMVRKHVFHAMTDAMARMILKTNFIHGDLHPGNLFVYVPEGSDLPEITLIDAGIAIEMSRDLADMARHAAEAAIMKNPMALGEAVIGLHKGEGHCEFANDVEELERKVGYLLLAGCFMCPEDIWRETFENYEDYRGSRVSEYFARLLVHLSSHKVRVSPNLWSLMTAFALIEGSVQELGHGVNVIRSATPYLFNPWDLVGKFALWKTRLESEAKNRR